MSELEPKLNIGLEQAKEEIGTDNPLLKFEISSPETIQEALEVTDLTEDGSTHCLNLVREFVEFKLQEYDFPNLTVIRGEPVVSVADNFDRLRFPADNAGRSSTYTRYVDSNNVLRTHTSALIPETLDRLKEEEGEIDDITLVLPGLVYRRDVSDKTHLGVFHQMDIWRVKKNQEGKAFDDKDLRKLVRAVFEAAVPGQEPIIYSAEHPYTLNGIEVYAKFGEEELEVLEAGLAHPEVLSNSGFNSEEYSGLALGMGIDRLIMARKNLPDIRMLRAENPRIAEQMYNLQPYIEVSNQPAITRDLSYVVPKDAAPEDISEWVREAFGEEAYLIEEVEIKTRSNIDDLHPNAVERLGINGDQINVLVNVVLRHPDRTLTKKEINELYRQAYPQLHMGSAPGYPF